MDLLDMSFEQLVEETKKEFKLGKIHRLRNEILNLLEQEEHEKNKEFEKKSRLDLIQKRFNEIL